MSLARLVIKMRLLFDYDYRTFIIYRMLRFDFQTYLSSIRYKKGNEIHNCKNNNIRHSKKSTKTDRYLTKGSQMNFLCLCFTVFLQSDCLSQ